MSTGSSLKPRDSGAKPRGSWIGGSAADASVVRALPPGSITSSASTTVLSSGVIELVTFATVSESDAAVASGSASRAALISGSGTGAAAFFLGFRAGFGAARAVKISSNLNQFISGYFDPKNVCDDNKNK